MDKENSIIAATANLLAAQMRLDALQRLSRIVNERMTQAHEDLADALENFNDKV